MIGKQIIKTLLPSAKKILSSGQLDNALFQFKEKYKGHLHDVNETIVIVNSTEIIDNQRKEYVNICVMNECKQLKLICQFTFQELIEKILELWDLE
jgi:hypothetical protein